MDSRGRLVVVIVACAVLLGIVSWRNRNSSSSTTSFEDILANCAFFQSSHTPERLTCARLQNRSTSFLWNECLSPLLQQEQQQELLLSSWELQRAVASHPLQWGRAVLSANRPIQLWILTTDDICENKESKQQQNCTGWTSLLQTIAKPFHNAVQITVWSLSYGTTEYYTNWIQHKHSQQPDIVLHDLSRRDMEGIIDEKDPTTVAFEEQRRHVLQHFLRALFGQFPNAILVFLDDYIPSQADSAVWLHEVNGRMLQQLTDYYPNTGLISYAKMVRRSVYAGDDGHLAVDDSYRYSAHTAILQSVLYSLLDFTVAACFDHVRADSIGTPPLVSTEVQQLLDHVLPPPLDTYQTLLTVSQEWRAAASTRTSNTHGCFYGTMQEEFHSLKEFLHTASSIQAHGWKHQKGFVTAAQNDQAVLEWTIENVPTTTEPLLYVQLHLTNVSPDDQNVMHLDWSILQNDDVLVEQSWDFVASLSHPRQVHSLSLRLPPLNTSDSILTFRVQVIHGIGVQLVGAFACELMEQARF